MHIPQNPKPHVTPHKTKGEEESPRARKLLPRERQRARSGLGDGAREVGGGGMPTGEELPKPATPGGGREV